MYVPAILMWLFNFISHAARFTCIIIVWVCLEYSTQWIALLTLFYDFLTKTGVGDKVFEATDDEGDVDFDDDENEKDASDSRDADADDTDDDAAKKIDVKKKRFSYDVGEWVDLELVTAIDSGNC